MEFNIIFFNISTKSKGKGLPKSMTRSIKYTKVVKYEMTYAPYYMRLEGIHDGRNILSV